MSQGRKITIGILIILILALIGISIYVALNLRTPPDSGVATCVNPNDQSTWHPAGTVCDNAACGPNACDGSGPLECRTCQLDAALLARGIKLLKLDSDVCMDPNNVAAQEQACGGLCYDAASDQGTKEDPGYPKCTGTGDGGGPGDGGGDGNETGLGSFSCNEQRVCTLSDGIHTIGAGSLDCNVQTGYVHYCPNGLTNYRCITSNPTEISRNLAGGSTVDVNPFLNKGCGAYQVDFQPPTHDKDSGVCGAVTYIVGGENCDEFKDGGGGGPGDGGGEAAPITVNGIVACRDGGSTQYPVTGATVTITDIRTDGSNTRTRTATTDSQGRFTQTYPEAANTRQFRVEVTGLPSGTLPSGQPYSSMTGPNAANCLDSSLLNVCSHPNIFSRNFCGDGGTAADGIYRRCQLDPGETQSNFRFTYKNCGVTTQEPSCGDNVCQTGEYCEETGITGGGQRVCRPGDLGGSPTGPITNCRGLGGNNDTPECTYCGDGQRQTGEACDPFDTSDPNYQQCNSSCEIVQTQCQSLSPTTTTIANGDGNIVQYTLVYQSVNQPFTSAQIRLRVQDGSSNPVGRDANATSSQLVAPIPGAAGIVQSGPAEWTYRFQWEAATTAGNPITPDGNYDVRIITNGSTVVDTAACQAQLTIDDVAEEEPLFTVIKTSTSVCESNAAAEITYTITVTNVGPVTGVIAFVEDTYDPKLTAAGITPTGITPSYGTVADGKVRWVGEVADRTYTSGQSKTFSYTVAVPVSAQAQFAGIGVENTVTVEDDDGDTETFTLITDVACDSSGGTTDGNIPDTGIFDDENSRYILFAMIFMLGGLFIYRMQIGKGMIEKVSKSLYLKSPLASYEERMEDKLDSDK